MDLVDSKFLHVWYMMAQSTLDSTGKTSGITPGDKTNVNSIQTPLAVTAGRSCTVLTQKRLEIPYLSTSIKRKQLLCFCSYHCSDLAFQKH